jgi:hypothetical protein
MGETRLIESRGTSIRRVFNRRASGAIPDICGRFALSAPRTARRERTDVVAADICPRRAVGADAELSLYMRGFLRRVRWPAACNPTPASEESP